MVTVLALSTVVNGKMGVNRTELELDIPYMSLTGKVSNDYILKALPNAGLDPQIKAWVGNCAGVHGGNRFSYTALVRQIRRLCLAQPVCGVYYC